MPSWTFKIVAEYVCPMGDDHFLAWDVWFVVIVGALDARDHEEW